MKLSTVFLTLNNRDANWQLQNFLKDLIFMPFEKMTERVTPPVPAALRAPRFFKQLPDFGISEHF